MKKSNIEQLNIRISSELKQLAKHKAKERHQSLNGFINSLLELNLNTIKQDNRRVVQTE